MLRKFIIQPNPSSGVFNFDYGGDVDAIIKIVNINGKMVHEQEIIALQKGYIDISNCSKGMYFLIMQSNDELTSIKLIKN